jgi:hypothetical protein
VHRLSSAFVLGYHGCDRLIGEKLLRNEPFAFSENDYDWLGSGIYFWEANPQRALEWARRRALQKTQSHGRELEPFVIGAVIDLGFCLDLISSNGAEAVRQFYPRFQAIFQASGAEEPRNSGGGDLLLRKLDCAVLNAFHQARKIEGQPEFDTVRGLFPEGKELYPGSGLRQNTHIQICVRNPENIHGVFRVADRYFTA